MYVYVMTVEADRVKVGVSGSPRKRRYMVERRGKEPVTLAYWARAHDQARKIERAVHRKLKPFRAAEGWGREWFAVSRRKAVQTIRETARELACEIEEPRRFSEVLQPPNIRPPKRDRIPTAASLDDLPVFLREPESWV